MFKLILDMTLKQRPVIMCIKRYTMVEYNPKNLPYDNFVKLNKYKRLIKKMGYNKIEIRKILFHNQYLFNVPTSDIWKVYTICTKFKVDLTRVHDDAKIFSIPPDIVQCKIMALQEMGVENITAEMIIYFAHLRKLNLFLYKSVLGIPQSVDITQKLLKYIRPIPPDAPPLIRQRDLQQPAHLYFSHFYKWYLSWRLNLSEEEKSNLNVESSRFKDRSIRNIKKLINLLHDNIGLTGKEILTNCCLTTPSPQNLKKLLTTVKTFGGVDIKKIIKDSPYLFKIKWDNVMKVKKSLKAYGYTDSMMRRCPQLMLLPHTQLIKNLDTVENTPELRVLKNNTRSLMIVLHMRTVLARLEYFRYHKITNITVYKLTGSRTEVERIVRIGVDGTHAREIGFSLEKILKYDTSGIIQQIRKHPHWRHVDLVSINETANYLLSQFTPEDIYDNIQLLLYPITTIERILTNLPEVTEKSEKTKDIPNKEILAICLYEIEREHHFTGDGIWRDYQSLVTGTYVISEKFEAELADASDSENPETDDTSKSPDVLHIKTLLQRLLQRKVETTKR